LADILDDREVRSAVVGAVSALEGIGMGTNDFLLSDDLSSSELAMIMIAGAFKPEDSAHKGYKVFFPPVPNILFTRDMGSFFGDAVIISHPAKEVRRREGLLARYIFRHHPLFSKTKIIDVLDGATSHGMTESIHLEGGDVTILDKDTLLIGCSERTTSVAIDLLADRLLKEKLAKRIIKVQMPQDRATMHLDTVFTLVGQDDCVYYPPFFSGENGNIPCPCFTYELVDGEVKMVHESSDEGLFASLERIGKKPSTRISCGGDILHYQTREQWTDGANLFAVRPEVAFIYERNVQTIEAFRKEGYRIVGAKEFLDCDMSKLSRALVTVSGAELSRGRGGSRCMTMPVSRVSN